MMYGTDKNAGVIPKEIADKLREKQYNNFDEFRNDFWKAVAETDYANEFLINGDPKNYYRMKNGGAPLVVSNQAINGSFTYQLHHIIPINQGGSVYSVDNLVVVTPRYHAEILIPEVHGYNGFKQFLDKEKDMDKLSREEVKELVEKISYGMGSDEEVSEWIQKIMDSVPNRNVVEAIMSGPNASIEEILDKLYTGNVIRL